MPYSALVASRLTEVARSIAIATSAGTTDERLKALSPFLEQVREALGMEVAFVSQFIDDQRVFRVVSSAPGSYNPVQVGGSDPLLDTYCMYVVQGKLPPVIRDMRTSLHEAAMLPVTERLGIGCYVSAPVVLPSGQVFGTLCCFSSAARPDLLEADGEALRGVARAIGQAVSQAGDVVPPTWKP